MIGLPEAAESETVRATVVVPESPSATEAPPIDTVAVGSSSTIVPVPVTDPGATFVRFESWTVNVSSNSSRTSPWRSTATVFDT